ncbi:MAG: N-acetyltransferase [Clostridia bacterium]|jgi:predicted N-acetyltransferase YhbS|nr:N-acetyltransferase [Clostridia bacterium]
MKNDYIIRIETSADYSEVENLTREAFWNVYRPGCLEHYVLHRYRTRPDFIPELSLCLTVDNKIIAHVMYARSEIHADDGRIIPIMTFGPISVAPDFQHKGYGTILLQYSMKKAKKLGAKALAITGNINFYGKSGFAVASTKGIHYYAVPREDEASFFLIKELEEGFLDGITGTYADPDGYDCEGVNIDTFDAQFPPKKKLKLPGQLV